MKKHSTVWLVIFILTGGVLLICPLRSHALVVHYRLCDLDSTYSGVSSLNVGIYQVFNGPHYADHVDDPVNYPFGFYFWEWTELFKIYQNGSSGPIGYFAGGNEGDEVAFHNAEAPKNLRDDLLNPTLPIIGKVFLVVWEKGPFFYDRWHYFGLYYGVLELNVLGGGIYQVQDYKSDSHQFLPDGTTIDTTNPNLWNDLKTLSCGP